MPCQRRGQPHQTHHHGEGTQSRVHQAALRAHGGLAGMQAGLLRRDAVLQRGQGGQPGRLVCKGRSAHQVHHLHGLLHQQLVPEGTVGSTDLALRDAVRQRTPVLSQFVVLAQGHRPRAGDERALQRGHLAVDLGVAQAPLSFQRLAAAQHAIGHVPVADEAALHGHGVGQRIEQRPLVGQCSELGTPVAQDLAQRQKDQRATHGPDQHKLQARAGRRSGFGHLTQTGWCVVSICPIPGALLHHVPKPGA